MRAQGCSGPEDPKGSVGARVLSYFDITRSINFSFIRPFFPLYIFGPSEGTAVALKGRSKCKWGSRDRFLRPFLMVMRLYESRGQYVLLYVAVGAATAEPSFHGGLLAA